MRFQIVALAGLLSLGACAGDPTQGGSSNTASGAVVGAAAGGAIGAAAAGRGNRAQGAVIGALAGAALGAAIGSRLDAQSEARRQAALNKAAEDAARAQNVSNVRAVSWSGSQDSGSNGRIQPRSKPTVVDNKTCMEVTEVVTIGGQRQEVQETRCRGADGKWV